MKWYVNKKPPHKLVPLNRGLFPNSRFFRFQCLDSGEICLACWILELKALFGVDKFNKVHVEVPWAPHLLQKLNLSSYSLLHLTKESGQVSTWIRMKYLKFLVLFQCHFVPLEASTESIGSGFPHPMNRILILLNFLKWSTLVLSPPWDGQGRRIESPHQGWPAPGLEFSKCVYSI